MQDLPSRIINASILGPRLRCNVKDLKTVIKKIKVSNTNIPPQTGMKPEGDWLIESRYRQPQIVHTQRSVNPNDVNWPGQFLYLVKKIFTFYDSPFLNSSWQEGIPLSYSNLRSPPINTTIERIEIVDSHKLGELAQETYTGYSCSPDRHTYKQG